ncbi:PREDICTED: uncharacterized protein LOC109476215 [Branchiostoma belcheri]|uniref:Uncharacterized protein LOC109476215 n=1 Tax=Branchiostoma belcheri TaxID=7741 RepID=A0A6P4ZNP3_BRABE|nr:PREDICTED: uncharacterized protein LOC109476215 [Branchiostoma belcheri]
MAGLKLAILLFFLFAFDASEAGLSCARVCEMRRTGSCPMLGGIFTITRGDTLPCVACNTTGQADQNPLGCLPGDLKKLQVAGHSGRSGRLKPLPRLAQLVTLILGPGNIRTVGRGAFAPVPGILALSMEKNAIKVIGSWFGGITKLEKLALSWNEVEEIQENAFQPLRWLEYLELNHNKLRAVEERHFSSLANLVYLHLSYNNISHIAGKSFDRLSRLHALSLDHNKLSFLSPEWLQGLSTETIFIQENPFRCTCALGVVSTFSRLDTRDRMRCSYPPSLSGRKVDDVARGEMPCPPPAAKVSRQDRGATLVCEVFWEKRPEIGWMDPRGSAVGDRQALDRCGGTVTTRLEHDYPTTQSPEAQKAHPSDGLPYIGKSTSTLHMDQQAYRCWNGGSFRCVVRSATTGSVFADLPLNKARQVGEEDQTRDHAVMTTVHTSTPARQNAKMTETTSKTTTDKNGQREDRTPLANRLWFKVLSICLYYVIVPGTVLFIAYRVAFHCCKCYFDEQQLKQRRLQRHIVAAGVTAGIPLQNLYTQPPTAAPATGNPVPPDDGPVYDVIQVRA